MSTTLSVTPFRASDRDMALPLEEETALAGARPSILAAEPSTAAGAQVTTEMVLWTAFCSVWATPPRRPCALDRAATWGPELGQHLLRRVPGPVSNPRPPELEGKNVDTKWAKLFADFFPAVWPWAGHLPSLGLLLPGHHGDDSLRPACFLGARVS